MLTNIDATAANWATVFLALEVDHPVQVGANVVLKSDGLREQGARPGERERSDGAATVSLNTCPVNHSTGPAAVSTSFLVILRDRAPHPPQLPFHPTPQRPVIRLQFSAY